ncbi:hypothetical protein [Ureibacillus sinduriensis]|uniref:Uncharacterized protein n=1 Tax=Ureibacillus sinduriensis BLB-1 = JCM 15800 TaxID=1384057 RepID=A0A0A3HPD1_9BACL|nr:hypothetical protein [Ureibacillus sinduriensis]KGR74244.1 hypothetical protein CD33_19895 [Ureibacillus sinduriensis BLB-1 = JCM 15800]
MEKNRGFGFGNNIFDINAVREAGVTQEFREHIGMRALILIAPFPFLIIGTIEDVVTDYLILCAEVTNINELDGEEFRIHIDEIEVFYIEKDHKRPIPDIRNGMHA